MIKMLGLAFPIFVFIFLTCVTYFSCGFFLSGRINHDCGGYVNTAQGGATDYLESPGFPETYPDNSDCMWIIEAPEGSQVHIESEVFSVEPQANCLWDFLSVGDGQDVYTRRTVYCGYDQWEFTSMTNIVSLHFHSDHSGSQAGFRLLYRATNGPTTTTSTTSPLPAACNRTVSEEGQLTSPGYPEKYPSNLDCFYLLQAPPGLKVHLTFTDFNVEHSEQCNYDMIVVYDGGVYENLMTSLCGSDIPLPLTSSSNTLSLRFHSDTTLEHSGFRVNVEFIDTTGRDTTHKSRDLDTTQETSTVTLTSPSPSSEGHAAEDTVAPPRAETSINQGSQSTNESSPILSCNTTVTTASRQLASPGFPNQYPDEIVCITRVESANLSLIVVRFPNFTLEDSQDCAYDSVSIYPLSRETPEEPSAGRALSRVRPPIRVMCGAMSVLDTVVSWEGHGLEIEFRSDRTVSAPGYMLEIHMAPLNGGPLCEDVCQNGASCLEVLLPDGSIDFKCTCAEGYTGNMCDTALESPCDRVVCQNGGVCSHQDGHASCACPVGFAGELCEDGVEPNVEQTTTGMYFTKMTGNMTVSVGSNLVLECAVSDPEAQIMWLFHDRILTNEWSHDVKVHPGGVIVISAVNDEHSGRYTCMALTSDDLQERSLWLTLNEPCSLTVNKAPSDLIVREGKTALFECYIPDADLTYWRKDGDIIEPSPRKRILVNKYLLVSDVVETDAGQYTCAARSSEGCYSQVSAQLNVETSGHNLACGRTKHQPVEKVEGRISEGEEAEEQSAPWHTILICEDVPFCGGSLISPDTVVTAAHCIAEFRKTFGYGFHPRHVSLYLGTNHCLGRGGLSRRIKSYFLHENFNDTRYNNDIALLKLDSPVQFTDDVMPICLETPEFVAELLKPGQSGVITGCGTRPGSRFMPNRLHQVTIPYVARDLCEKRAAASGATFTNAMFCAGYLQSMRGDACQGDSGGPFHIKFHGRAIQVGIISWGVGCDIENQYGYYTDLSHFYPWIMDHLD